MKLSFLNKENTIKAATAILVTTLALSNVLGVIRDHFLAQKIATDLLDTYYAAFRLPDLIFNVIILGAVSSAFIPTFSTLLSQNKKEEAHRLASAILTLGMAMVIGAIIVLYAALPLLTRYLVPDFSPEKQLITLHLSRLLLLPPIFFALSYFFSAVLNSYKRFMASSLAPLIYNVSIIIATYLFADIYGVFAVAWGVIIGALLHMFIQLIPMRTLGLRIKMIWDIRSASVRQVGQLMLPRSIGLGALQIMFVSFTSMASGLGMGAVAILSLADNIQTMPTVVFGTSVASALFPTLAEKFSLGKMDDFSKHIEKATITILYYLVPTAIAVILLRIQIVRLVLGSGHFGWDQTVLTAQTLGFFALSMVFSGLIPLFTRSFYALHNTRAPTIYAVISIVISIVSAVFFKRWFGVTGLALAFSLGSLVNFALLYSSLKNHLPDLREDAIWEKIPPIIAGTVCMGIAIQITKFALGTLFDLDRFYEVALQAGLATVFGASVYFATTYWLGFKDTQLLGFERIIGFFTGGRSGTRNKT